MNEGRSRGLPTGWKLGFGNKDLTKEQIERIYGGPISREVKPVDWESLNPPPTTFQKLRKKLGYIFRGTYGMMKNLTPAERSVFSYGDDTSLKGKREKGGLGPINHNNLETEGRTS